MTATTRATTRERIRRAGYDGPWHVRTTGAGWKHTDADVFEIGNDANGTRPAPWRLSVRYRWGDANVGWNLGITDARLLGPEGSAVPIATAGRAETIRALLGREPLTVVPYGAFTGRSGMGQPRCPACKRLLFAPWCPYDRWDNGVDPAPWAPPREEATT